MALIEGPWEHRFVAANGARFHVAEQGEGPVVLLLHGFPQFWWAWRHQMQALADAGYRACAMDLRGYGASDKPPRGYDTRTSATDVASRAAVARRASRAAVVGHGWGGWIAWCMPTLQPTVTRAIAARCRCRTRWSSARRRSPTRASSRPTRYLGGLQRPFVPERQMTSARRLRPAAAARVGRRPEGIWPSPEEARLRRRDGAAVRGALGGGVLPLGGAQPGAPRRVAVRRADAGARSPCRCCSCTASATARCCPTRRRLGGLRHRPATSEHLVPGPGTSCPRRRPRPSTPTCPLARPLR